MRKILVGFLSFVAVLATALSPAGPAMAADNVMNSRCVSTDTSLGSICVRVYFDNTNCDAHSLDNCSGLNGAKVVGIVVRTQGEIALTEIQSTYDVYGDQTSDYWVREYLKFRKTGTEGVYNLFTATIPTENLWLNEVNRVCVRVRSAAALSLSGVNIGGMNPYGISQAGACDLPA